MTYAFSSLDELGDGPGFRKVRGALGVTAFPDIIFELQNIVIGPQGVVEEAIVTGTHRAKWLDNEPTGETMTWRNAIFFPWDPASRRFKGERVYTDMPRRSA